MDEYRYLISLDNHNILASDTKKLDKFIICGHVGTYRLHENGSHDIYKIASIWILILGWTQKTRWKACLLLRKYRKCCLFIAYRMK